jgi:serine-type D-Ala-D-Ala carboxypeptidase (penicillin-binding protein 5/6)
VTWRLMRWTMAGVLVLGFVGSALAARTQTGSSRLRSLPGHRTVVAHREHTPLPPIGESLTVPRVGGLPEPPGAVGVNAASAILMDGKSGSVLFERYPDAQRSPASVTKILTALVVLEHGQLDDTVLVSRTAAETGGFRLGLRAGQRISLNDLLAAILIRSANDAAVAAAEHVGKSLNGFVALMNETARELGMTNSHFANPHGLDEPFHYTTARDMAILTRVALDHPTFARLVRTRETRVTIWKPGRRALVPQVRIVLSHNRLLGRLEGADGVKTGYTDSAGRCLVASASRGNQRMIAVLLNDPHRWTDAAALLEYGFGSIREAARVWPEGRTWHFSRVEGWSRLEAKASAEERP